MVQLHLSIYCNFGGSAGLHLDEFYETSGLECTIMNILDSWVGNDKGKKLGEINGISRATNVITSAA